LIVYHNKFAEAHGWIRTSAAYAVKTGNGDDQGHLGEKRLVQKNLGEGLGLRSEDNHFAIFRDYTSGLEYLRSSKELCERGLYVELHAYERNVFLDWREVHDENGLCARLAAQLNGRGTPSIDEALRELALEPVLAPFRELVNPGMFRWLLDYRVREPKDRVNPAALDEAEQKMLSMLSAAKHFTGGTGDEAALAQAARRELEALLQLSITNQRFPSRSQKAKAALQFLNADANDFFWATLLGWLCVHSLGQVIGGVDAALQSRAWIDEWLLGKVIAGTVRGLALDDASASQAVHAIKTLTAHPRALETKRTVELLEALLTDDAAQQFLHVNRWEDVLWFNHEAFEQLLAVMFASAVVEIIAQPRRANDVVVKEILACFELVEKLLRAEAESKFQVEALLAAARKLDAPKRRVSARPEKAKDRNVGRTRMHADARGSRKKRK
jgi:hypothetical protein